MKLKVTWPNGDIRYENSYNSPEQLIATMFSNGVAPEGVKVENLETPPPAPAAPAAKPKAK
jgi:hypothetical protein